MTATVVTPFPKSAMKTPPAAPERPSLPSWQDVPQHVRNHVSTLHSKVAKLDVTLGKRWTTAAALEAAEEELTELALRALAMRADLVQERKRLAGRG